MADRRGDRRGGIVTSLDVHLKQLERTTKAWLEHEKPTIVPGKNDLILIDLEPSEAPEPPETLEWLWRSRRLKAPIFDGNLFEWPYVLAREVEAVLLIEAEHDSILQRNLLSDLELKAKQAHGNV